LPTPSDPGREEASRPALSELALAFFRIGLTAYGMAILQELKALIIITATFIGFAVAGLWGSALTTFAIFFPSFLYTLLMTELYGRIRDISAIRHGLRGVLAAFTGMLLTVVLSLGKASLVGPAAFIWAVGAFVLVRWFKWNLLWIFGLGVASAALLYAVGINIA